MDELVREVEEAGFVDVGERGLAQRGRLSREEALERIRGKHISTLHLLDEDDFAAGLARAERELPDTIEYAADWAVVAAVRPSG